MKGRRSEKNSDFVIISPFVGEFGGIFLLGDDISQPISKLKACSKIPIRFNKLSIFSRNYKLQLKFI